MEALIALSLLVTGVSAVAMAFSRTRDALQQGYRRSALAACAQEKILEETAGVNAAGICSGDFAWVRSEHSFSPDLQRVRLTAMWTENGVPREETFEVLR